LKDFQDIALNVVASLLFVGLGILLRSMLEFLRHYRGRRFWGRSARSPRAILFLGTFPNPKFLGFEPSGLIGAGDTRAVFELTRALTLIGTRLEIAYSSRLADRQLEKDLILLGGGDSNAIFRKIEESGRLQFQFHGSPLTLRDLAENVEYRASLTEIDLSQADTTLEGLNIFERDGERVAGTITTDYGILARMRNPYNPRRKLILIAGLYGYGTWGAHGSSWMRSFSKSAQNCLRKSLNVFIRSKFFRTCRSWLSTSLLGLCNSRPLQSEPIPYLPKQFRRWRWATVMLGAPRGGTFADLAAWLGAVPVSAAFMT
jgi:hypothetical protein